MPFNLPETCQGCPFASKAKYFTPDSLSETSEVMILAQNPGNHEEQGLYLKGYFGFKNELTTDVTPQPLIGPTGRTTREQFWPLSRLENFDSISKANIIKCRPNGLNDLPPIQSRELKDAINHCVSHHFRIPKSVKYILTLGQVALYGLTQNSIFITKNETEEGKNKNSFFNWRGYVLGMDVTNRSALSGLYGYYDCSPKDGRLKVLPTIHPASLFKDERMFRSVKMDFVKFGRLVRGEWPSVLPEVKETLPETLPNILGFDTEYDIHDNNRLTLFSIADTKGNVYAIEPISNLTLPIYSDTKIVGQNLLVDLSHFYSLTSSLPHYSFDDLMIAHSVLYPGEPHSLNYICSIDGKYNRHKHLSGIDFKLYAGLDADTTLNDGWRACLTEFKRDPLSWKVYYEYRKPLIEILYKAEKEGIKVHDERLSVVKSLLEEEKERLKSEAILLTGRDDFNLGSGDHLSQVVYDLPIKEKKVKSPKPKKDPLLKSLTSTNKPKRRKSLKSALLQAELDLMEFMGSIKES